MSQANCLTDSDLYVVRMCICVYKCCTFCTIIVFLTWSLLAESWVTTVPLLHATIGYSMSNFSGLIKLCNKTSGIHNNMVGLGCFLWH